MDANTITEYAKTVFDTLGPGHSESVYHNAMEVVLRENNVPYASEVTVPIMFMGKGIGFHRLDTVLYCPEPAGHVILEYKSITRLKEQDEQQVKTYLKTTGYAYGILINFGASSVETRIVSYSSQICL
jgi:GxxExxY protein